MLGKMLDAKLIEPSVSEWASPPVLIRKRDGTVRYAIDYRKLNSVIKRRSIPSHLSMNASIVLQATNGSAN